MYKRGSGGLTERERRRLKGDWWDKIRLGEGRYRQVRLCSDKEVSERWRDDLQNAVDRLQANDIPDWDRLKRDGVPRRLLESLRLVNRTAVKRRADWREHLQDYARELRTAGCNETYVRNIERYLSPVWESWTSN